MSTIKHLLRQKTYHLLRREREREREREASETRGRGQKGGGRRSFSDWARDRKRERERERIASELERAQKGDQGEEGNDEEARGCACKFIVFFMSLIVVL